MANGASDLWVSPLRCASIAVFPYLSAQTVTKFWAVNSKQKCTSADGLRLFRELNILIYFAVFPPLNQIWGLYASGQSIVVDLVWSKGYSLFSTSTRVIAWSCTKLYCWSVCPALAWEGPYMCVLELHSHVRPYTLHSLLVVSRLCCRDKMNRGQYHLCYTVLCDPPPPWRSKCWGLQSSPSGFLPIQGWRADVGLEVLNICVYTHI